VVGFGGCNTVVLVTLFVWCQKKIVSKISYVRTHARTHARTSRVLRSTVYEVLFPVKVLPGTVVHVWVVMLLKTNLHMMDGSSMIASKLHLHNRVIFVIIPRGILNDQ